MAWHGQVETREWLTPGLVRIVLGGPGLTGLVVPDDTDTYVNVAIAPTWLRPACRRSARPRRSVAYAATCSPSAA
jgi:NADPH-dependent ferric siderophore reductase